MQLIEPSFISLISAYLFFGGCLLGFIWIGGLFYYKFKWLLLVEDVLDDGVRFYTLNIFFSGLGGYYNMPLSFYLHFMRNAMGCSKKERTYLGIFKNGLFLLFVGLCSV